MKNIVYRLLKSEEGQAFPMALVVLAVGSLLVGGFLTTVTTGLLTSRVYSEPILYDYTADAGVEDAIWELKYGTLAGVIEVSGQVEYTLDTEVNGLSANISVTGTGSQGEIAVHDFEDRNWAGGSGWLYGWYHLGSVSFTTGQSPRQGRYHVAMSGNSAYLDRAADLSAYSGLRLQFWAKVRSFEVNDRMYCMVSPDDTNWTQVYMWDRFDSDNQYHYYDIDLSSFEMTSEFWIAFDSEMSATNDYFYIDDLKISGTEVSTYTIVSTTGQRTTTATVDLTGGIVAILSWESE